MLVGFSLSLHYSYLFVSAHEVYARCTSAHTRTHLLATMTVIEDRETVQYYVYEYAGSKERAHKRAQANNKNNERMIGKRAKEMDKKPSTKINKISTTQ